jgi:hypothetical protein
MTTDRTPHCTKIRYGITGAPPLDESEMDGSHAPGVGVSPTSIELVYSAARDGKPASVSASVTGDWTRFGKPDGGQVTTHFPDGPDGWPVWLAEEARLHDPAVAQSAPAETALRDRIAEALMAWAELNNNPKYAAARRSETVVANAYSRADAVLAVLPPSADRAAILDEAIDRAFKYGGSLSSTGDVRIAHGMAAELQRMADEAQPQTEIRPQRGDQFEAWLKTQRDLCVGHATSWGAVDGLLDQYRLHADTGTPLAEHVCEGKVAGDCECLGQPAVVPAGAGEEPAGEAEAHPPTHTWKVESPRRDKWASWGATHDERVWAAASYDDVIEVAPQRPFRLVRATTTYAVEAEHQPAAMSQPGKEA